MVWLMLVRSLGFFDVFRGRSWVWLGLLVVFFCLWIGGCLGTYGFAKSCLKSLVFLRWVEIGTFVGSDRNFFFY